MRTGPFVIAALLTVATAACGDSDQDKLGDDLSAAEGRALDENEANFAEAAETPPPPVNIVQPREPAVETPLADEPEDDLAPRPDPSFDCEAAGSRVERWICADDDLAALDRTMDSHYARALDEADPARRAILQRSGRLFLSDRNNCPDAACVAQSYRFRLREIADIMDRRDP